MGRNRRWTVIALLTLLSTFGLAGSALAQNYPAGPSPITCSTTTVQAGSSFTCSAGGFQPGSSVAVTATGSTTDTTGAQAAAGTWTYNTTVTANSEGVATATIQVPGDAVGPVSVTFEGIDPEGQTRVLSAVAVVTVAPAPSDDGGDAGAPDDGEGTAATGGDFTTGIIAVVTLLVVGGGLLFATRRRHHVEV